MLHVTTLCPGASQPAGRWEQVTRTRVAGGGAAVRASLPKRTPKCLAFLFSNEALWAVHLRAGKISSSAPCSRPRHRER